MHTPCHMSRKKGDFYRKNKNQEIEPTMGTERRATRDDEDRSLPSYTLLFDLVEARKAHSQIQMR